MIDCESRKNIDLERRVCFCINYIRNNYVLVGYMSFDHLFQRQIKFLHEREFVRVQQTWKKGAKVAVHVSLTTVTRIRFRPRAVISLKLPWSHVRRVLSSLTPLIIACFLRVFRFPPAITLDP